MKKIYISICALAISFSSIAQLSNQSFAFAKGKKSQKTTLMNAEKSAPLWSEDFANGIPATWNNLTNAPWVYRGPLTSPNQTTGGQGAYATAGDLIVSVTAANGFIIFDSDYYDNNGVQSAFGSGMYPTPHNGELMTGMIDLTAYTDVTLSFNSYYRTFAGQAFVDFYVGGGFTERVQVHANVAVNDGTFTDEIAEIRVPFSVVGNANVQMSFVFEGSTNSNNGFTGYYFWMIDDLELMETPNNLIDIEDLVIGGFWLDYANYSGAGLNSIVGLDYTITPTSQLANHPHVIEGVLRNEGSADQTSMLKYEVYGAGSYSGSSAPTNIPAYSATNTVDSVIVAASPSLSPVVGSYSIAIWGESDSAGVITTISDTVYKAIEITDYIYGKDLGEIFNNPGSWILGGAVDQNHITTRYEMYANESLTGLRAFIDGNSVVGAEVKAVIYELDTNATDGLTWLAESDNYTITAQDTNAWVDIPFVSPISLLDGHAYEFGIAGFQHPLDSSFIGTSGKSLFNGEHSLYDEFGLSTGSGGTPTWYYITATPMVRMNFGPITAVGSWDCIGNACLDPGTGNGMYASVTACMTACGVTSIWCDDFSDPSSWIIAHDPIACSLDWQIGINSCQGSYPTADILSTSASNGYALIDSDAYGSATGGTEVEDCWLTMANPVDLNGYPNLVVEFETNYRSYNSEKAYIVVGIGDGAGNVTWPDLDPNSGTAASNVFAPFDSYASGDATTNPELIQVDISSALVGLTPTELADIYIRFHWTGTWGYAWFVDDVCISLLPDNAISSKDEVIGGFWDDYLNYTGAGLNEIIGLDYTHTPQSQLANHPFVFESIIKNTGIAAQSVVLHYNVTGAVTGSGMSPATVLNGAIGGAEEDAFSAAPPFGNATTAIGSYSVDMWAEADSAGAGVTITTLPAVTKVFEVTDYIYGKDLGNTITPGAYVIGGPVDQNHITTRYEMYANESLYGLRAFIGGNSAVGAEVKAVIYEIDSTAADGLIWLDESDNYTITAQDLGAWVDIPFLLPIDLLNGYAYEFGIAGYMHPTDSSFIGLSGTSMYNGEHSSFDELGLSTQSAGTPTWYYITSTPMVRMNFGNNALPSWDCIGIPGLPGNSCVDPGTGNGIYASVAACLTGCGVTPTWDCIANACVDPGTGLGTYASVTACQSNCVVTPTWDCDNGVCLDPGTGQGAYTSFSACDTSCVLPSWDCIANACVDPGTGNGIYASVAACLTGCGVTPTWDCIANACVDPGTGLGTYASVTACQSNCVVTPTWDCMNGVCVDPGTGLGAFTSVTACLTACGVTPSWNCISVGNCQDPGNGTGAYTSLGACDTACVAGGNPTWNCISPGNCQDPGTGTGQFGTLAACDTACVVVTPSWNCISPGNCQDPGTGTGVYTSLSACDSVCVVVAPTWNCISVGDCQDPGNGTGAYTSLATCDTACAHTAINEEISSLLIYPNPAKNTLTIDGDYISATIYNVVGKAVLNTDYQKTINVAALSSGIYFININTSNANIVKKITIAK